MRYLALWISVTMALFTAACASQKVDMAQSTVGLHQPKQTYPAHESAKEAVVNANLSSLQPTEARIIEKLTMADLIVLTLKYNSTLAAFNDEIRSRDALIMQSGLLPNPSLSIDTENFAGRNDLRGFDGAETTISVAQLIELGGKRSKRSRMAAMEKDVAVWEYESRKLDILNDAAKVFIHVLALQEQAALNEDLVKLATKTFAAARDRVEAGKVSPVEKDRAQIELASSRSEANKVNRELNAAQRRLASFWERIHVKFEKVAGSLSKMEPPVSEEQIRDRLDLNPDFSRWRTEIQRREAALELARSLSLPDVSVRLGVRHFQETDDSAVVAGVEIPLPFFDRNQGGIREAHANLAKTRQESRAADIEAHTVLYETLQRLNASHEEAVTLRDEILPGATGAFEAVESGYREGKLNLMQVLDAQRALFFVRRQYLQALELYHIARSDLERLVGGPLKSSLKSMTDKNY